MKSAIVSLLLLLYAHAAPGQVPSIYVDFGPSQGQTISPDTNGHFWNNVTELTQSGLSRLRTESGSDTPISLGLSGSFGFNPGGTTVPNQATLLGLAVPAATQDWAFVQGSDVMSVTLGNLAPNGTYRLSIFGSRNSSETRSSRYDIIGLTSVTQRLTTSGIGIGQAPEPDANRSNLVVVENLVPSLDGNITILVRRDQSQSGSYIGSFAYLNALRLEAMSGINFPPVASSVVAVGAPRVSSTLIGSYSYSDYEQDVESGSEVFWERASSLNAPSSRIANTLSFSPSDSELGCYVRFGVLPKALSGYLQGRVVYSNWIGPIVSASTISTYHVGSSFTLWSNMPLQLKNLSASTGQALLTGQQLTAGKDTRFHWENGIFGGAYASGTPSRLELATGSWDVAVLQPYNSEWFPGSVPQMRDYLQRYYTLADSHGAQVYLYNYWPWLSLPLSTQSEINSVFENIRSTISVGGNRPALIIPAGPALKAVIDACGSGALTGYSRSSFYRDNIHTNDLGSYVSALAHYATILKRSPVGLPPQAIDSSPESDAVISLPSTVATRIQQIVWNVVGTFPNTGIIAPIVPPPPPPPPPVYVSHGAVDAPEVLALAFGPSTSGSPPEENLPHPVIPSVDGQFAVEYRINPDAEALQVSYTPEWSEDLVHWTQTRPDSTIVTRLDQTVRVAWPKSSNWRFFRVYVDKPE